MVKSDICVRNLVGVSENLCAEFFLTCTCSYHGKYTSKLLEAIISTENNVKWGVKAIGAPLSVGSES